MSTCPPRLLEVSDETSAAAARSSHVSSGHGLKDLKISREGFRGTHRRYETEAPNKKEITGGPEASRYEVALYKLHTNVLKTVTDHAQNP